MLLLLSSAWTRNSNIYVTLSTRACSLSFAPACVSSRAHVHTPEGSAVTLEYTAIWYLVGAQSFRQSNGTRARTRNRPAPFRETVSVKLRSARPYWNKPVFS